MSPPSDSCPSVLKTRCVYQWVIHLISLNRSYKNYILEPDILHAIWRVKVRQIHSYGHENILQSWVRDVAIFGGLRQTKSWKAFFSLFSVLNQWAWYPNAPSTKKPIYIFPPLRPPKVRASYLLKTLFAKFKLFFSSFTTPSVPLIRDHLWYCPKVVLKTTFGQSQRWFLI